MRSLPDLLFLLLILVFGLGEDFFFLEPPTFLPDLFLIVFFFLEPPSHILGLLRTTGELGAELSAERIGEPHDGDVGDDGGLSLCNSNED